MSLQFRSGCLSGFSLSVPEKPTEDLPAGALWNCGDELNAALQPFVPGLVFLDVLCDISCGLLVRFVGKGLALHHICFGYFAGKIIWDLDDGAVRYGRVGEEMGL